MKERLMTPGPVEMSSDALLQQARPMTHHRAEDFQESFIAAVSGLRKILNLDRGELFLIPSSGTGGMEAAVVNLFSPNDKVLAISNGIFGERFAAIARTFGLAVEPLDVEWGLAVDPAEVARRLKQDQSLKGVLVVFHDTSTGIVNDLEALGRAVSQTDALLVVDGVSGVAVSPLPMDSWRLDCVVGATQKGLSAPPGVAFVALNERAWAACETSRTPRFYYDLRQFKRVLESRVSPSPWTPPVATIRALRRSIDQLFELGLDNVYRRQAQLARAVHVAIEAMGLRLFGDPHCRSAGVTVVLSPDRMSPTEIVRQMQKQWGVTLAGGLGRLRDKAFRIGHMGQIDLLDVVGTMFALEVTLNDLGFRPDLASSTRALLDQWLNERVMPPTESQPEA